MAKPRLALRVRRARRRLMFLGLRAALRTLGLAGAAGLGRLLGALQYRLAASERRRIQAGMAAALGMRPDDPALPRLLRQAYETSGAAVLELACMLDRRIDEGELDRRCRLEGLPHLEAALQEGRGAIVLAAHMGNQALVAMQLARLGWPVSVIYKQSRMASEDFFQEGLERYGIQAIRANSGVRAYAQMLQALKRGRIVFVMLDQGVKRAADGMPLRFLGKEMPMPAGPAQLARTSRAPVLPVVTTAPAPHWHFRIEPPVPLEHASLETDAQQLVRATERGVLQYPQLWSWHQRRWRRFANAA